MASLPVLLLGGLAASVGLLYSPVKQRYVTLGIGRPADKIANIHGAEDLKIIPNTIQCEDLHHEKTTNMLFTACQATEKERTLWFPPLEIVTDPKAVGEGTIVRVDPTTFESTVLKLNGSPGPMSTHGIDILIDPEDPSILWIYIINHLPDPDHYFVSPPTSKRLERPHVEVFKHILGTDEAEFVRSVSHPLIIMPNDLLALSPTSFYISNDHNHHSGPLRAWEDLGMPKIAPSTTVVHVQIADLEIKDPSAGVTATIALDKVHNSNGLGHASPQWPNEMNVVDASGGILTRVKRELGPNASAELQILERIQLDSTLDNPSYYLDKYATAANNASGYILPGLPSAASMAKDISHLESAIPSCVWHVRSNGVVKFAGGNDWEKRLVFQDSGKALRTASGAVMVGIDPKENEGKKQAWLFVTGFGSEAMVAAKVDL